jgi:hypothetical protein
VTLNARWGKRVSAARQHRGGRLMVMTREQINELCERQEKSGPSIATEFGPLLPPGRHSKERSTARSASNTLSSRDLLAENEKSLSEVTDNGRVRQRRRIRAPLQLSRNCLLRVRHELAQAELGELLEKRDHLRPARVVATRDVQRATRAEFGRSQLESV